MKAAIGLRVVRGPQWELSDQRGDGGEGFARWLRLEELKALNCWRTKYGYSGTAVCDVTIELGNTGSITTCVCSIVHQLVSKV